MKKSINKEDIMLRVEIGQKLSDWIIFNYNQVTIFAKICGIKSDRLSEYCRGVTILSLEIIIKLIQFGVPFVEWLGEYKNKEIKPDVDIPEINGKEFQMILDYLNIPITRLTHMMGETHTSVIRKFSKGGIINKYRIKKLMEVANLNINDIKNIINNETKNQDTNSSDISFQDNTSKDIIQELFDTEQYLSNNMNDLLYFMTEKFGDEWIEFIQNRRNEESGIIE